MTPSINNVRLGICAVTVNSVPIGHTKGGAELTIKNDISEITVDKYGSTPAKAHHKGTRVELKLNLAEYDFTQMEQLINAATKSGVAATGTITYGSPSNGDTVVVDGHTFTKAASASGNNFSTIGELTTLINALDSVSATNNGTVITVTAAAIGLSGNQVTLTKTGSALVLSGATLTGGTSQLTIGKVAGTELVGVPVVLTPIEATADELDIELFKAVIISDSTFPFMVDGETVWSTTLLALVSPEDADGDGRGFLAKIGKDD